MSVFPSSVYLFVLLIVVLPSSYSIPSSYHQNAPGLVPETDLYLRFRKNEPSNRQRKSDEYIHPFIRFRKSIQTEKQDPYWLLFRSDQ